MQGSVGITSGRTPARSVSREGRNAEEWRGCPRDGLFGDMGQIRLAETDGRFGVAQDIFHFGSFSRMFTALRSRRL